MRGQFWSRDKGGGRKLHVSMFNGSGVMVDQSSKYCITSRSTNSSYRNDQKVHSESFSECTGISNLVKFGWKSVHAAGSE